MVLAVTFIVPCASAWTLGDWSGPASSAVLSPGDPVSAAYTVSFNSYDTGKTFESDHSLVMYTDLSNPQWVVTMIETVNDAPLKTVLANRQAVQVVLDGWSLSFSRKQFYITVKLTGTVPALNQSQEIILTRMQERGPDAVLVPGTQTKKVALISVPTPEPTPEPTVIAEETVLVITPEEPLTTVTAVAPTKKQTYSPGPDPVLICGMLAGLVLIAGLAKRRK
ncbi:MAG: hypothetical protein PHT99_07560 [Methanoregula sp.]|nr:hypothetical protein [Methanoregula sp.]